jgi:AcrR family transcriptional regulator
MVIERRAYDEKLEAILGGAAVVFAEKGYHNASIREIAKATGVSLSGLYYYFQSKEELLWLVQDHTFGKLIQNLETALSGIEDPEQKIRILIARYLTYFTDHTAEMKVLSHEAESLSGDYLARVNAKKRRLRELTAGILEELRPDSPMDLRVATFALFGMMNWIYTWYRRGRDVPAPELAEHMTRLFLEGFGNQAGLSPAPGAAAAGAEIRSSGS